MYTYIYIYIYICNVYTYIYDIRPFWPPAVQKTRILRLFDFKQRASRIYI